MELQPAQPHHIDSLMQWFPTAETAYQWGGPDLRFPFTAQSFVDDIKLATMASYSLVSDGGGEYRGKLLAFGQYYLAYGRCHLARLAVAPDARGQGLGRRLIEELLAVGGEALGVAEYSLFVLDNNAAARNCYLALGFAPAPWPTGRKRVPGISFMIRCVQS